MRLTHLQQTVELMPYYSSVRFAKPSILSELADRSIDVLSELPTPTLTRLGKAFAMGFGKHKDFLQKIADVCTGRIHELTPKDISNLMVTFSRTEYYPKGDFIPLVAERVKTKIIDFDTDYLCNVVRCFAIFRRKNRSLFAAIDEQMCVCGEDPATFYIANFLWSYASLNVQPSPKFWEILTKNLEEKLPFCKIQDLSNIIWSMTILKHHQVNMPLINTLFTTAVSNFMSGHFSHIDGRQLSVVCFHLSVCLPLCLLVCLFI